MQLYLFDNNFDTVSCLHDMKNPSRLMLVDLSVNQLSGEIPNCIWDVGYAQISSLNLSHNLFSRLQEPYKFQSPFDLDQQIS